MKKFLSLTLVLMAFAIGVNAQLKITGTVTDASNNTALVGATVVEKGTTNGTITNIDGNYTLQTKGDDPTLVFSFIGYKPQEIPVAGKSTIDVALEVDASDLDEVVVVGYGVQKKSHLTGSISKVKNEKLDQVPVAQASEALMGKISGVTIQTTDGSAGAEPTIRVRGIGSVTGDSDPLIVIDGVAVEDGLSTLDMNDVESIEVLKDAASAAIYGSRAANGVVMVTTKSGIEGKPVFTFNAYTGIKFTPNYDDVFMDVGEWNEYVEKNISYATDNLNAAGTTTDRMNYIMNHLGTQTDWLDVMFDGGMVQNYSLSARGGTENSKYYVSMSYLKDEGVLLTDDFEKINMRVKVDTKFNDRVSIGASVNPSYTDKRDFPIGIHDALRQQPWLPIYHTEETLKYVDTDTYPDVQVGDYAMEVHFNNYDLAAATSGLDDSNEAKGTDSDVDISTTSNVNPYAKVVEREYTQTYFKLNTSAYLKYKIMKGLNFKTSFAVNYSVKKDIEWQGSLAHRDGAEATTYNYDTDVKSRWVSENMFSYNRTFGKHDISAVAGMSFEYDKADQSDIETSDYEYDYIQTLTAGTEISMAESYKYEEALHSVISRVNYAYDNKYLFSVSARWDGSSRFGENNRYGFFPAGSFGWRVSEEDFLKDNDLISNLKLRASYGSTGNKDGIELYQYISLLQVETAVIDGSAVTAYSPSNIANNDLKWEKAEEINLGADVGLFDNRLNLGFDVYKKTSSDLLLEMPVSGVTGFTSATVNRGEVENSGIELQIGGHIINKANFKWQGNFNVSFNKNELTDFAGSSGLISYIDSKRAAEYIVLEGHPITSFYGYKYDKDIPLEYIENPLYPINAESQDVYVKDLNGDGMIDDDDRAILGSPYPTCTWGYTNTITTHGFDFSFTVQGSHGAKVRNMDPQYYGNQFSSKMDYTDDFPDAAWVQERIYTDLFVQDASFIALRSVNLGYTLPRSIASKAGLSKARVYVSGSNLVYLMADDYTSFNPEGITEDDYPYMWGYQRGAAPISKAVTFGINLEF